MNPTIVSLRLGLVATMALLASCASTGAMISAPGVALRNVELTRLSTSGQTVLLGFDVSNPNPFPLPVRSIAYGVALDGHRFASGRAESNFTIPAEGDGAFAVSVELDLLKSAPALLYIVKDSLQGEVDYALEGEFGLDLPLVQPVPFEASGSIRLQARAF